MIKKTKLDRPSDPNQLARFVVDLATSKEAQKKQGFTPMKGLAKPARQVEPEHADEKKLLPESK